MTHSPPSARVTALILVISSLTVMANATISPSLPGLARAFSDTPRVETLAGLVLSLPSLSIVLSAALIGLVLERINWKRVLVSGLVVYALAGASAALMDGMTGILLSRVGLGLGVAATMTVATMLAGQLFDGAARDRFMGWQSAAMSGGGILFIMAGGALAEISWRGPFLVYLIALPVALLAIVTFRDLDAQPRARAGQSAAAVFPWAHMAMTGALAFFVMAVFYLIPTKLPFRLEEMGTTSPSAVGLAVAVMTLAATPGALLFGRMRSHLSPQAVFAVCFMLMAMGYLTIAMADGYGAVLLGTVLSGAGLGPTMPNIMSFLMSRIPGPARGRAAGLVTTAFFAGQFASPLLGGAMTAQGSLAGTFAIFAAILLAAAALFLTSAIRAKRVVV